MANHSRNSRRKVCVIGLDGVPFSLLEAFAKEGLLPNISKVLSSGTGLPMTTTFPEISSVSWTSFMTGRNPGKHGIYGFADIEPENYQIYFPNYCNVAGKTLWDVLGKHEKRSVVVNMPSTYPAQKLNGVMVSGFVSPNFEKAFYPSSLAVKFKEKGYRIDIDLEKALESRDFLIEDILETHNSREQAILSLMANGEWDLFIGVITETDRLHHFLWAQMENGDAYYGEAFIKYYQRVDGFIGKVQERIDDNTLFIIVSDHGFCKVKKQVYLNHWLQQAGYLSFKNEEPQFIMDIDPKNTKAFCLDPGRLYLNMKNRFGEGILDKKDYEGIREELKEAVLALRSPDHPEERVVKRVRKREEIYHGPNLEKAPDLVVEGACGFDLKGSVAKKVLFDNGPWTGMHTSNNAAFLINKKIKVQDVQIFDVFPTILNYFDIDVTSDIDGRVLS